ncbi:hypothetical protein EIP91_006815 [Steccherinum ochraceum]|uniref:Uncharacterized protein n=1 Tax=Steccherinum ochraceum TaxID=92696 RepID=A0A4R0RJM6_9APHY|nr:hypothetical protein EIP91_006815 [Steccherinum ochraceum]
MGQATGHGCPKRPRPLPLLAVLTFFNAAHASAPSFLPPDHHPRRPSRRPRCPPRRSHSPDTPLSRPAPPPSPSTGLWSSSSVGRCSSSPDHVKLPTLLRHSFALPLNTCTSLYIMIDFPSPILSVASDVVSELDGEDAVYGLWTLFTKCKRSLKDGHRLENISWRLWYREMSNSHCSPSQSPGSTSPPLSDSQGYSPITPTSEDGPDSNLAVPTRDSLLPAPEAHTAHSWHGQSLAPSASNVSRRLSTASMPARPHPKSTPRAGKFIIEILPDTLAIPPRSPKPAQDRPTTPSGTASAIPTVVPSTPRSTVPAQRPLINVPSNTTSPSTSLGFPSVVVVNPTPHPTPPATPLALRPLAGASSFASASAHLLPPPVRRPSYATRQTAETVPLAGAQQQVQQPTAPALSSAGAAAPAALAPPPCCPSHPPPSKLGDTSPSPPSAALSKPVDETLKPSDRRFFLQQSESPDERSPDAESPLASTSKLSDTQSPSSEASSQMKTNVGPAVNRRAATLGKARARKSKETVRHAPVRAMSGRAQTQRQAQVVGQKKIPPPEPKKAAFNIGSTSSNGSRGTGTTGQSGGDERHIPEDPRAVRSVSPPVKSTHHGRSNGQGSRAAAAAANGKINGNAAPAKGRGIVVSTDSDFETTESDDDSEWASEESPDEQELARQREETRLREAAEEAQRQRDMFAKVPKRSYTDLSRTRSGLLSQLLNPDPNNFPPDHPVRTSFSTQDMTQLGRHGRPVGGAPTLTTSKSTVAVPLAAQVTASQVQSATTTTTTATSGGYRPKGRPQGEEMEYDSDSGDETGDNGIQVPRSLAQQKLAALAGDPNRRRHSDRQLPPREREPTRPVLPTVATAPIALGYPYNLPAPAPPMTPRTTRRQMLSTELSESLRRNLLWERQVSKVSMTGGARRGGGLLSNGLRPLTAVTQESAAAAAAAAATTNGNGTRHPTRQNSSNSGDKDERKRAAMARNRSWADDYHTSGW